MRLPCAIPSRSFSHVASHGRRLATSQMETEDEADGMTTADEADGDVGMDVDE